jgi:SAM-dependent methyltransferase
MSANPNAPEFDQYAKQYAKLLDDPIRTRFAPGSGFFFERKRELLVQQLGKIGIDPGNAAWLDVGCGAGELLRLGSPHFATAVGCDVSTEMLKACTGLNVTPQTDPAKLPFPDASFDVVTVVCVYHHVEPPERAALTAEIARVLRPGGAAGIIEHNPFNPITQLIIRRTPVDEHARLLTARAARRLLTEANMGARLRTTYFLYLPEKLYRKASVVESWLAGVPAGGQFAVFGRKQ